MTSSLNILDCNQYPQEIGYKMEEKENGVINDSTKLPNVPGSLGFDPKNLTPQEKEVANSVLRCLLESTIVSGGTGYLAFKLAGNYISTKGNATMKSWSSVIKFGVAFGAFSTARSIYGRGVCLPRVRSFPPSPIKDEVMKIFDQRLEAEGIKGIKKFDQIMSQSMSQSALDLVYPSSVSTEVKPIHTYEEQIDDKNHETDIGLKAFDTDRNTHSSYKGRDFDNSKSYSLPPAEISSKHVRRNKYGDIIEDV